MHTALTIAGSDSGGGAGIQADLKTFVAHGVYGTSAITAVTAQNTNDVLAWEAVAPALVLAQIEAVLSDIGADAIKTGMLANAAIVRLVADTLRSAARRPLVVDPVMVAKGGGRLLEQAAVDAIVSDLLPLATVVTPNIPEAEVLAGMPVGSLGDMREAGRRILDLGPRVVLVKGGHLEGRHSVDIVCMAGGVTHEIAGARIDTTHTHGTGCTLASAIAANLATGLDELEAIALAKVYVEGAIRNAPGIGTGHGPLGHFWRGLP